MGQQRREAGRKGREEPGAGLPPRLKIPASKDLPGPGPSLIIGPAGVEGEG